MRFALFTTNEAYVGIYTHTEVNVGVFTNGYKHDTHTHPQNFKASVLINKVIRIL